MRRLQQLLQARLIFVDDVLYFTFKKHVFTGAVVRGGLIWKCTWQKPGGESVPIFCQSGLIEKEPYVRTFESLTDWTETCIQECLDEYHTRYSSWKRVRHRRTEQPMEVLFKHLQKKHLTSDTDKPNTLLLFEQLSAHRNYIDSLKNTIAKWEQWFTLNHEEEQKPIHSPDKPTEPVEEQAQPFVLTSDTGQYMVLHRLNEVAPTECVSWLKENGKSSFESLLETVRFEPTVEGIDRWKPVDTGTSQRFLHNFFKN